MPETLYVEGPGRDEVIARIRNDFGYTATITDVKRIRRGGVLGFFAREFTSVAFHLNEPAAAELEPAEPVLDPEPDSPPPTLEELLERADEADGDGRPSAAAAVRPSPAAPAEPARTMSSDDVFAELLAQIVAAEEESVAESVTEAAPTEAPEAPVDAADLIVRARPTHPEPRRPAESSARVRLEMISELRSVGVPVAIGPDEGETNLYRAIEQIVEGLPPAPAAPSRAGDVVVLAGTADQLDAAVPIIAKLARASSTAVWRAGAQLSGERTLNGPAEAAQRALEMRTALTASVVVVELERARSAAEPFDWSAQVIAAVAPTALWVAVDAGRKTEDVRAELAHLGPIDALIVSGVADTSSPATVWDLDLPIAIVDGRPATRGTWSGLLFDALESGVER